MGFLTPVVSQLDCSLIVGSQLGTVLLQHTIQSLDLLLLEVSVFLLQLGVVSLQCTALSVSSTSATGHIVVEQVFAVQG